MTTNHNHTENIAKALYDTYSLTMALDAPNDTRGTKWNELTQREQNAWNNVAKKALPIIGSHTLEDIEQYLKNKTASASGWKKALYWIGGIIAAGLAALGLSTVTGCGHEITITPDHAEICKDGSCLILDKNSHTITYRQHTPDKHPVLIQKGK